MSPARSAASHGPLLAAAVALGLLVSGCSGGPVQVPVPSPDAAEAALCETLSYPEKVNGLERRETDPSSPYVAAWGSPAIAVRCGVARPTDPDSGLIERIVTVDGLDWLPAAGDRPSTWTLVARNVYVEVTIPQEYTPAGSPPGELLTEFTSTLDALPKKPEDQY
ncbi:DUF3515 domain-containing protein [Actinocorallia sp. A-T 12471]|uniref:DUF3515 domain-containing protein n=1 Tax=Actinocorallia sp. A-T 12471 TaxID=3089813 RepID=UPI0029CD3C83|nr:DUF3515 domain-containing protein [Actinocorallia sp. A-T 12471]MDX6739086.1 DUF3515 domain-containing protein [Actinocorallia sp. A-T 12471]